MKAVNSYMVCRQHLATMAISTCHCSTAVNSRCNTDQANITSAVRMQGDEGVHGSFPTTVLPISQHNALQGHLVSLHVTEAGGPKETQNMQTLGYPTDSRCHEWLGNSLCEAFTQSLADRHLCSRGTSTPTSISADVRKFRTTVGNNSRVDCEGDYSNSGRCDGITWGVVRKSLMAAPIEVAFVACPWATLAAASAASSPPSSSPPDPPLSNPISAVNTCMRVSCAGRSIATAQQIAVLASREACAARYNTWLLIELTPKGVVFSFLLLHGRQSTVMGNRVENAL